ncbi:CDP-diacylglycerol--glycerol-3-phosphate 3-phosphatidyltransferase [Alteromonadaceae bacterium M269]|nr:CDP-diacylglycerol--glycerol-3-phosphate 3-phosphatidyltransferase [Alteromonadaceae bacterium M269]
MWTIPNILTVFRIILIPVFLIMFYLPVAWSHFAGAFVFWLASITDALDGYLARKLEQSTPFGAFLDPVADKLMVAAALVVIVQDFQSAWITIPALVMICREILISALREWMSELGNRDAVAVSNVGKFKTIAQMLALIGLLWQANSFILWLGYILLYVATALTFWSMFIYIKAAWGDLTTTPKKAGE